ncbi:hypothetical protein CWC31_00400 [Pseudoalteromonas ruthenica]|nr:hypothetical protein CWC31_00400 [Pseudoalteromonas ruthenica]TMO43773.1 hypothetical protein CWC24_15345 [Pseudoalteromonas ruthenica]TMO51758.1 hypothetical protein CWC23_05170 [Pseudoalteromonas ruthenica]
MCFDEGVMRLLITILLAALVTACAPSQRIEIVPRIGEYRPVQENTIHQYSVRLANNMTTALQSIAPGAKVAVGTFLPPQSLTLKQMTPQQHQIALQLQESFITLYNQMGFSVVEYRTRNSIALRDGGDVMLSREVGQLAARHGIDFFVTGTMTPQQDAYVVNVRMINISNNEVVAAATDYLPNNVLTSADKVHMQNGHIERRAY